MINPFITKKSINKIYQQPVNNSYSQIFYENMSTGFSLALGEKNKSRDFFTFEPDGCIIANLLHATGDYDLNHRIEQTINMTMHSLLMYGQAYIYLQPQYKQQESDEGKKKPANQTISALDIGEIKGIIKKRNGDKCIFYSKEFNDKITERELLTDGLISLNIRELGYRKKYFPNLLKKLGKCDMMSSGLMTSENTEGYDFNIHLKKTQLNFLKKTKSIGWTFGNKSLSDSYILYRKILLNKFRIKALDFIVNKINKGFSTCLHNESPGKLVAHIKKLDYDDIWEKYSNGELTVTELTNLL